jgi:hypothetical protein
MGRSGPRWVSYLSAAEKLGITLSEVEALVQSHLVRSLDDGEAKFVAESDLDELSSLKELPPVDTARLARNQALIDQRVHRLEEAVNLLFEANQFTSFNMGYLDDQTLIELYGNILQMLEQPEWPLPRLLNCAEVYHKLTEVEVERLIELSGQEHPWRPFLELCVKQLVWLAKQPSLLEQYEWARARDLIHHGLGQLRRLTIAYCSLKGDPSPLVALAAQACREDTDLIDILVCKNYSKTP